jgi:DNA-binding transcriptional ArsR family regulator
MLATLTALAEPNRLRIVELLRRGPQPVGEIGARLRLRQPQVSKHLRVLRDAGLVDVRPVAQQRHYELQPARFDELAAWIEGYRQLWAERYDELDVVIAELKVRDAKATRTPKERSRHAQRKK